MALLGSSIDPRLQLQDYSGIVNAAQMQAQGLAGIGSQIEQAAQQYKQYKKEQTDAKKRVKSAQTMAESISSLIPSLAPVVAPSIQKMSDPNTPLYEADAIAQTIENTLKLGMDEMQFRAQQQLQREQMNASAARATSARDAALIADAEKMRVAEEQAAYEDVQAAQQFNALIPQIEKQYAGSIDPSIISEAKRLAGPEQLRGKDAFALIEQAVKMSPKASGGAPQITPVTIQKEGPEGKVINEVVLVNEVSGTATPAVDQSTGKPISWQTPKKLTSTEQSERNYDKVRELWQSGNKDAAKALATSSKIGIGLFGGFATDEMLEQQFGPAGSAKASGSGFPKTVRQGRKIATVQNQEELDQAIEEGWSE